MRLLRSSFIALLLFLAAQVFAGEGARATPAPVLPNSFGGWQLSGTIQTSPDPAAADGPNAALLKEYGFSDFASGTYIRDDGRKVAIKAARFADASGAYGAFTYYKMPQMITEQIGDQGSSLNERILFYRGNILVDAVFQKLTAMSAAELRELAASLPKPPGNTGLLPGLPTYLPRQSYVKNSAKYVMGPLALEKVGAPLAAPLVDFASGAEVAIADYDTTAGQATLMLISYPTPQIATAALQRIDAAQKAAPAGAAPMYDKRSGPIVAVATGSLSADDAKTLLGSVNYDADVTWNQNTYFSKKDNVANLLVNAIILCAIIGGLAIVAGIAFGGIRVLIRKLLPERTEEVEFISLHLSEGRKDTPDSGVSSSIEAL